MFAKFVDAFSPDGQDGRLAHLGKRFALTGIALTCLTGAYFWLKGWFGVLVIYYSLKGAMGAMPIVSLGYLSTIILAAIIVYALVWTSITITARRVRDLGWTWPLTTTLTAYAGIMSLSLLGWEGAAASGATCVAFWLYLLAWPGNQNTVTQETVPGPFWSQIAPRRWISSAENEGRRAFAVKTAVTYALTIVLISVARIAELLLPTYDDVINIGLLAVFLVAFIVSWTSFAARLRDRGLGNCQSAAIIASVLRVFALSVFAIGREATAVLPGAVSTAFDVAIISCVVLVPFLELSFILSAGPKRTKLTMIQGQGQSVGQASGASRQAQKGIIAIIIAFAAILASAYAISNFRDAELKPSGQAERAAVKTVTFPAVRQDSNMSPALPPMPSEIARRNAAQKIAPAAFAKESGGK